MKALFKGVIEAAETVIETVQASKILFVMPVINKR